jgi:hypothetical protein
VAAACNDFSVFHCAYYGRSGCVFDVGLTDGMPAEMIACSRPRRTRLKAS